MPASRQAWRIWRPDELAQVRRTRGAAGGLEQFRCASLRRCGAKPADLDADETDDLVRRLYGLSLLQSLDLGSAHTAAARQHDLVPARPDRRADGCRAAHAAMVRAMHVALRWRVGDACARKIAYGWRFLIRHLRGAGQDAEADQLLTDYAWIKAKLTRNRPARPVRQLPTRESQMQGRD